MNSILLDTNAYSHFARGDSTVKRAVFEAKRVNISTVTLGELYLGFVEGGTFNKNNSNLELFLGEPSVFTMNVSKNSARLYGKIKYEIRKIGKPIPDNDIWIAACTLETDSELITYDRHFLHIPGLKVWKHLK